MKINKKLLVCALMALMILVCVNAVSAEDTLNANLTSGESSEIMAIESADEVVASQETGEALAADSGSEVLSENDEKIYVDSSFTGTSQGTEEAPYKTIKEAITNSPGDNIIYIKNGEYVEGTSYNPGKSLTFVGESKDGVIVSPSGSAAYLVSTSSSGYSFNFVNITFKNYKTTSAFMGLRGDAYIINCTFDSINGKPIMIYSGTSECLIQDCTFKDIILPASSGVIYSNIGTGKCTIKNVLIDHVKADPSLSGTQTTSAIIHANNNGYQFDLDGVTISNCEVCPGQGLVKSYGITNIANSRFVNNVVSHSATNKAFALFYVQSTLNIEQSVIADNNVKYIFYESSGGSVNANYNNIRNNTISKYITYGSNYNLDANWWGSDVPPTTAELTQTANPSWSIGSYVIDSDESDEGYNYTLDDGSELEKSIPELPGLEPVESSVVIDDIADVIYPANVSVTYAVENPTTVTIVVKDADNNEITEGVDTSVAGEVTISGLAPGDYTISITNADQGLVVGSSASASFSVIQIGSSVVINAPIDNVTYPGNVTVTYTVENQTTISVIVKDEDENEITEGIDTSVDGQVTILGLAPGDYTITIVNEDSESISGSSDSANFSIIKMGSSVVITTPIDSVTYPGDVVVAYTVENQTTISVIVKDEDENEITDGIDASVAGEVSISGLAPGDYTITIVNDNADNVIGSNDSASFSVAKAGSSVVIDPVEDVTYPGDVVVDYTVENETSVIVVVMDADGNDVTDGVDVSVAGEVTVSGLAPGDYIIVVANEESDLYTTSNASAAFSVAKAGSSVVINPVEDVTYPGDVVVTYSVENETSVSIVVRDADDNEVTDGVDTSVSGQVTISNLDAGAFTITISNAEDSFYNASSDSKDFNVLPKSNVTVKATSLTVRVDQNPIVNIVINETGATGSVKINVDGVDYSADVVDGAASITLPIMPAGKTTLDVFYTGDDLFNNATATVNVNVNKYPITLKATAATVRVGNDVTVKVTLSKTDATGPVSIIVNGNEFTANATNGKANIVLTGLPVDQYALDVNYGGDDKYKPCAGVVTFNVNKIPTTLKATARTVHVGDDVTVNVVLSKTDATGVVSIVANGEEFTANATNGKASVVLSGLPVGQYSLDVNYQGDENYKPCAGVVTFNVNKIPITLKATARTMHVDEDVTVNVVLSKTDATGVVSIVANGEEFTANATNGKANVVLSGLPVGQYSLDVNYQGDENYKACSGVVTFNVNKWKSSITASARTVKVGDNVTVNVALPSDATGEVVINVNGTEYTGTVENGAAVVIIPDLPAGQYAFDVTYNGDDKYKSSTAPVTFNVNKHNVKMKATARTVKVGNDVTVNVALSEDATGEVVINVNGNNYTGTVTDGAAAVVIPDLPVGQYALDVDYGGDAKYKPYTGTVTFNVNA